MTYTLYNRLGSAGLSIEAALKLGDIEFELVELDSVAGTPLPDSFRKINPWNQVPTLILPNGETLTESAAILAYLASAHPQAGLGPSPGDPAYPAFLRWLVFASNNLHEPEIRIIYPERFTTESDGRGGVKRAAISRMGDAFGVIDTAIGSGDFLLGQDLSAADIYIAMLYGWYDHEVDVPAIAAMSERVREHPVVGAVFARHDRD